MSRTSRIGTFLDRCERFLDSFGVRVVLSCVILFSVLPEDLVAKLLPQRWGVGLDLFFLCVFVPELVLRLAVLERRRRKKRLRSWQLLLVLLDLMAVLSFLPLVKDAAYLRLLRLGRLLLLVGYWGGMARDLGALLFRRERRYQVTLALVLGLLLAFFASVIVVQFGQPFDYDGDEIVEHPQDDFLEVLWWSFRQVQDPGNLVTSARSGALVVISLLLTLAGLFLFSFFIGIGANAVGDLVERSRSQPVGLEGHTVILGLTDYSHFLLQGLVEIYRKNLRPYRAVTLASREREPEYFNLPELRHVLYRSGNPARGLDLERVSIRDAKRVIILGSESEDRDSEVLSAILATRERNPAVPLYPDLEHERNFRPARAAGGDGTHLVGSGSLLGYYVAQNVIYPGIYRLYRQLLASSGCEIYTYIFSEGERRKLVGRASEGLEFAVLYEHAYLDHGVNLLGFFTAEDLDAALEDEDLDVLLNPVQSRRRGQLTYAWDDEGRLERGALRGVIGIALRFEHIVGLARELISEVPPVPPSSRGEEAPVVLQGVELRPPRNRIDRVVILGASPRVPRVVMELVGHYRSIDVSILARDGEKVYNVAHDIQEMLTRSWGVEPTLEDAGEDEVHLRLESEDFQARIDLLRADWMHAHRQVQGALVSLEDADAILLLPAAAADTDGQIALDCLHLADLERAGAVRFQDSLRILAMVRDPAKGDLLERRLEQMAGGRRTRYTVISQERARHEFLVHGVFVRGLNPIYLDLLGSRGQVLSRWLPEATAGGAVTGSLRPWDLARDLLFERGLVFVGLELKKGSESPRTAGKLFGGLRRSRDRGDERRGKFLREGVDGTILVDPRDLGPDRELAWEDVRAVFVIGHSEVP